MDRQSLLEQKRQRLQELKQRRLGNFTIEDKSVNELVDQLQNAQTQNNIKHVNVAVQVDNIIPDVTANGLKNDIPTSYYVASNQKDITTYDKAIQATVDIDEEVTDPNFQIDNEETDLEEKSISDEFVIEPEEFRLNSQMKESFKLLNKIIAQEISDSTVLTDFSKHLNSLNGINSERRDTNRNANPFKKTFEIPPVSGRSISSLDVSPHYPFLMIASYTLHNFDTNNLAKKIQHIYDTKQSPGLAIIYNIKGTKAFPEYILNSTSSITTIKFDKVNPNKIIGGLSDGKVVIWDLLDNRGNGVARLPLLMTPILSSIASSIIQKDSRSVNLIHHSTEISSINQITVETNECIISTSADGVVNLWSSNLLAWPRVSSLKLDKPQNNSEGLITSKEPLSILKALALKEDIEIVNRSKEEHSLYPPAYKFMNKLLVGSEDGKLFKLSNNHDKGNIEIMLQDEINGENPLHSSTINSIIELVVEGKSIIITSGLDWYLKVWNLSQTSPLISIPVNYIILDLVSRPKHPKQFVTVGIFNQSNDQDLCPIVEFWDFSRRLMNPVSKIPVDSKIDVDVEAHPRIYASSGKFDDAGENIIIGFNDGSILILSIDDIMLDEVVGSTTNKDIDDGLSGFLQRGE